MASNNDQSTSPKGKRQAKVPKGAINMGIEPEEIFDNAPPNRRVIQIEAN
jgi:hypothetical protein